MSLVLALLLLAAGCQTGGSVYPDKPVTVVVLDPAGGPTDLVARQLAEVVKPHFSQPFVVVNRPGGAGTIAAAEVAKAAPDGYTIGLQAVGPLALQPHRNQLPYQGPQDFAPIIRLVDQPLVLAARANAPWQTANDLLAHAKANPKRVRVAIPGAGTIAQLALAELQRQTGAAFAAVPFGSAGEAVLALLGGEVEAAVVGPPTLVAHVQAGRAKVLGVLEAQRDPLFPTVPSLREQGYDITLGGYFCVVAPPGTPAPIVTRLHDAFQKALASPEFQKTAAAAGLVPDYAGPEALGEQLRRDFALYGELVRLDAAQ
jgi:tripartite-type tricarboxylate transporter receptor subunit TctC